MTKRLVIVESPTKARTLKRFLGEGYVVESSVGHVRDLPAKASEIPEKYKKEPWARLGVNVNDGFRPLYVVQPEKKKTIAQLRKLLKDVDELLLATDEDREGEAISWHLLEVLKPKVPTRRMVFHEITRSAIARSLEDTREINLHLVGAQETRRIIDRLYGYEVSPILWKKIAPRLSAGRVQSVAIRMLVERDQARLRFVAASYWNLDAVFQTEAGENFSARLQKVGDRRVAGGKDFDPDTGELKRSTVARLTEESARALCGALPESTFKIQTAVEKPFSRNPAPPFTTSTLQQESNRKLGFGAKRTMKAAQRLYENGFITYMRTDSVVLSQEAIRLARSEVHRLYGEEFLPEKPRYYKTKVKNAQEAHEAIRPAGSRVTPVPVVRDKLGSDEARVYELIWKRTLACQMKASRGRRMTVHVAGRVSEDAAIFVANGTVIDFPGYLRAYVEGSDDPEAALAGKDVLLPPVGEGDMVGLVKVWPEGHFTAPPARLTEATLVKALEESGIGRPSTYASIIDTIQRREYSFKKGAALVPTFTAFAVVTLMQTHLSDLIASKFTVRMEDRLDAISRGEGDTLQYLEEFYFGDGSPGLKPILEKKVEDIDARAVCTIGLGTDAEGVDVQVRVGRYGPYLQREETTAPIPDKTCPDELTLPRAAEILEAGAKSDEPIGSHPETDEPIFVKSGRFGPYVQLGTADRAKKKKPKMISLLKGMTPETVDLATALRLLEMPRTLGNDEEGREVQVHLGRYGPYVTREKDSRSLKPDDHPLEITLGRALQLFAEAKGGRRKSGGGTPLKVYEAVEALGGVDVKLLAGRYGPYVTDGTVNASLPKDVDDPTAFTVEEAVALIEKKRASGKGKKKPAKRKKAPAKKKAAKKKPAKKKPAD